MQTCPACQAVVDEKAAAAGHCSKCGAALHRIPKRTIQDITSQPTIDLNRPVDLETVGNVESIDIELVDDSTHSADTLKTMEQGPGSEAPQQETSAPDIGLTLPLGSEKTIEFVTGVDNPELAESMATAQWQDSAAESGTNSRFTIKQEETVTESRGTRSSVVVKSRQFRSSEEAPRPIASPADAPDYELLDVIGEGGMGVVYSARQSAIARTVAVKMLKKKDAQSPEQREKFISEAVVTGELDHPNIVPIYDLGANDSGALFYSMKRVKGTPWDDVLKTKSLDENLNILLRVADAVAFAHANGVVHRDLKPENVMLGDYGEVLVMDWGLARISPEFPNAASVTQSNVMGGTPAYMAPEMATGPIELVTTASDVYLLGAILYEIVTGSPPHTGKTVMACLLAAAKNQIPVPQHSTELTGIALKAMATQAVDRYQSVQEFQQAVRDYQSHSESILLTESSEKNLHRAAEKSDYELFARALHGFEEALALWSENQRAERLLAGARFSYAQAALSRGDFELGISLLDPSNVQHQVLLRQLKQGLQERESRGRRLTWLKRVVAALVLAVVGIVSVAFVIVRSERDEAVAQRIRAEEAEGVAEQNYEEAEAARQTAETERQRAENARAVAETQRQRAESEEAKAIEARQAEEYEAYVARIGLANEKIEENAFDRATELLSQGNHELANWEWGRLSYLCNLSTRTWHVDAPAETVAYSPDGKMFATGDFTGQVCLWDPKADTDKPVASFVASQYIHAIAFDPTGNRLAVGCSDNLIRIYQVESRELVTTLAGHSDAVLSVQFSNDGSQLLSAGYDNTAILWDLASGQPIQTLRGHNWWVWSAEFSPSGNRIVTAGQDHKVIVWARSADYQFIPFTEFTQHHGPVYDAHFSPDGTHVASAGYDRRVLLWDPGKVHPVDIERLLNGEPQLPSPFVELGTHEGPVRSLAFSPDGSQLASGGQDNVIRIWHLDSENRVEQLRGHASHVRDCAYSPDGNALLSAGRDATIKLWRPADYAETVVLEGEAQAMSDAVLAARYSKDGKYIVTASRNKTATLWDVQDRDAVIHFAEGHEFLASNAVFFADGTRLATGAGDGSVRLWDVTTGTELTKFESTGFFAALAVSPDGRWVATGSQSNDAQVWNASTGDHTATLTGHEAPITALAFSSDGQLLATGDDRGLCRIWKRDESKDAWLPVFWLQGHSRTITKLVFTQNDRLLISASGDNTCGIWDVASGQELRDRVLKHPEWITDMDVSDDGMEVLTACDDGKLRLWALDDSQLLASFQPGSARAVYTGIELSADGRQALATCAATGEVFLLDLTVNADSAPQPWLKFPGKSGVVWSALFVPGEEQVLTIGGNDARLWDIATRTQVVSFSPHGAVSDADVSPDDRWVVTGSWDRTAKIWDAKTGDDLRKLEGMHKDYINSVQFSPDGSLVLTGSDDGTARLWDARTGRPSDIAFIGHEGRVLQARFDETGKRVLTVSADKTARVWNAQTGETERILKGHEWTVLCGAFSRDGQRIITGSEDNLAIIWDANSGERLLALRGHIDRVTAVALSPDATRALTGSQDSTIKLWDAVTGKEILTLKGHTEEITSVGFSPDGLTVLSSSRDGKTILWPALSWQ